MIGFSDGLTLLAGGQRVFPVDYLDAGAGLHMPLTELSTFKALKEGATTTICVAWPDTGEDAVILDHQGASDQETHAYRLTDIPVKDG